MKRRAIGFDREGEVIAEKKDYDNYENEWVVIGDGESYSGKVIEVNSNRVLLLPYHAINSQEGRNFHEIVYTGKPFRVPLNDRTRVRPTTERDARQRCDNLNREAELGQVESILKENDLRLKLKGYKPLEFFSDGSGI